MNEDEAIELLEAYLLPQYPCHFNDFDDACLLAIKKLKERSKQWQEPKGVDLQGR